MKKYTSFLSYIVAPCVLILVAFFAVKFVMLRAEEAALNAREFNKSPIVLQKEYISEPIPFQKPDASLTSILAASDVPAWEIVRQWNTATTTPDYPGVQNVEHAELRLRDGYTYAIIREYAIADKKDLENYLALHAVPGQEAQMDYFYVSIPSTSRASGIMGVGSTRAFVIESIGPWSIIISPELLNLVERIVSLPRN